MNKINICHVGSSEWFNYKQEIIFGLFHSLRLAGRDVIISHNNIDPLRINIIIGADWLVEDNNFKDFINSKMRFIIFEVEAFDGNTINFRKNFNIENYKRLIDKSISVITPYRFNLDQLRRIKNTKQVQYLKWGFFEELIDVNIVRNQARRLNGVFFGLLKGDRLEKAQQLQKILGNRIAFLGRDQPHLYRSAVLSNTEYAVSLSYGDNEKFANPFRLYYLYANGINVVSDNTIDEDGYLELSIAVSFDKLADSIMIPSNGEHQLILRARENSLQHNIKSIEI